MRRRSPRDVVALIREACALEQAGMRWKVKHVAAMTGYSDSFIHNSDCPKHPVPGGHRSKKEKPMIEFKPREVRTWYDARCGRRHEARVAVAS